MQLECFREIWLVDFEFYPDADLNPVPVCLVARELRSGRQIRLWRDEFGIEPPYSTGPDVLFVAYYASAEIGCHLALGWPVPQRILDLYVEFRALTNGLWLPSGNGLLGALTHFGLDGMNAGEKTEMRDLILSTGPWSQAQRDQILDYCESDVAALARLLPAMEPRLDVPRALLRGRSMVACARMERNGVPMDGETLALFRRHWEDMQLKLIGELDKTYGVFDGRTFKRDRFAGFLVERAIPWPRLGSGELDLGDDTFRQMAKAYPAIAPLHELRASLSRLRLNDLAIGADGRNRVLMSPFRARTGRNQPSNSKFIFGPSAWTRGLIKPPPGYGIAYIDWKQQEFGIAAALSGDLQMQEAYLSGDPYLAFAKQAGAVPPDATKSSHKSEREQYKACVLAVQYGMGADSLAQRIGQPPIVARDLLRLHRETYATFWRWSDGLLDQTMLTGCVSTVFGWPLQLADDPNPRSLSNFPMQANGAEMLRLACCMATEEGIELCAPVHDAVLIAAPLELLDAHVTRMQAIMVEASQIVLNGFALGSDAVVVRYPDRYMDDRGKLMWETVNRLAGELEQLRTSNLLAANNTCSGTGAHLEQHPFSLSL